MTDLVVKTNLKANEILDRALDFFIDEEGLAVLDMIAHLHAEKGACEIRLSGGNIQGNLEYTSGDILMSQIKHLESDYGFEVVYFALHIHKSPNDDEGHLMVTVKPGEPAQITFESKEVEFPVKEFVERLPVVESSHPTR